MSIPNRMDRPGYTKFRTLPWHLKNGGNVRDPKRCLRIYYFWEPDTQRTVIDHLPAHRRTGAT